MKKRTLKRYRPKRRLKLTLISPTKFFIPLSYLILLSFLIFSIIKYQSTFTKLKSINLTTRTISTIEIEIPNSDIKNEIEKTISLWIGAQYSKDFENTIRNEILKKYPFLDIKTSFNLVTGVMKIKASVIKAIARFENPDGCLFENLDIKKDCYGEISSLPLIKIHKKDSKNLEEIKKITQSEFAKIGFPITIYEENNGFVIEYPEIEILINRDFKYREEDFEKIKEVIVDARTKFSLPLRVDARFIDNGKIIVKSIKKEK